MSDSSTASGDDPSEDAARSSAAARSSSGGGQGSRRLEHRLAVEQRREAAGEFEVVGLGFEVGEGVVEVGPGVADVSPEDADCLRGQRAVAPVGELRVVAAARPRHAKQVLRQHARHEGAAGQKRLGRCGGASDGVPTAGA